MRRLTVISILVVFYTLFTFAQKPSKEQVSYKCIYGNGSTYCAFTSLVKTGNDFYLAFREAKTHVADNDFGVIQILRSSDGERWALLQTLAKDSTDLRDPNLSVMPSGQILLLCGARRQKQSGGYETTSEYSILSHDTFSQFKPVNYPQKTHKGWIWKLTWHNGIGYGGCYKDGTSIDLVKTIDGINYQHITTFRLEGKSYETKILFHDDEMMAFVRREKGLKGMMGVSNPPYNTWSWKELEIYLAGQELMCDNETTICITRTTYNIGSKTNLYLGDVDGNFSWNFSFPSYSKSGGDTGYAGIIKEGKYYWVSYYAQYKQGKPSIFLAKIPQELIPQR